MKTRLLLLVGSAAFVLLAIFVLRARQDAIEAQTATSALVAQNNQLGIEERHRERRLREARASVAAVKPSTAAPRGDSSRSIDSTMKPTPSNAPEKTAYERRVSARALLAGDPAMRPTYLANFRARLDLDHGGMFKALRLSPEQIEKFKDTEVWLHQERIDLEAAIETQQLDRNSPEARQLWSDYFKASTAKRTEALGQLGERYLEYSNTTNIRDEVQKLARPDIVPEETVTADQVERATDILVANSQRKSDGGRGVKPGTVNWPVAREQLKAILSPAQIERLGLFMEREAVNARYLQLQTQVTAEFRSRVATKQK
jgi:hypothetical protein